MKKIVILVVAYVLTGLSRALLDFMKPAARRPPYAKQGSQRAVGVILMALAWLPAAIVLALRSRRWTDAKPLISMVAALAVLATAGELVFLATD